MGFGPFRSRKPARACLPALHLLCRDAGFLHDAGKVCWLGWVCSVLIRYAMRTRALQALGAASKLCCMCVAAFQMIDFPRSAQPSGSHAVAIAEANLLKRGFEVWQFHQSSTIHLVFLGGSIFGLSGLGMYSWMTGNDFNAYDSTEGLVFSGCMLTVRVMADYGPFKEQARRVVIGVFCLSNSLAAIPLFYGPPPSESQSGAWLYVNPAIGNVFCTLLALTLALGPVSFVCFVVLPGLAWWIPAYVHETAPEGQNAVIAMAVLDLMMCGQI